MHITLNHNIDHAAINPIELELVHTQSYIAIDVQSVGKICSSIVITQALDGTLEALIYNGDPQDVVPHREPLRAVQQPTANLDLVLGPQ